MDVEGDGPMPPDTAHSDSGEGDPQARRGLATNTTQNTAPTTGPPAAPAATPPAGMADGSGSSRGSDVSDSDSSGGEGSAARRAGQWPAQAPPKTQGRLPAACCSYSLPTAHGRRRRGDRQQTADRADARRPRAQRSRAQRPSST
jgi:hypothetical protein